MGPKIGKKGTVSTSIIPSPSCFICFPYRNLSSCFNPMRYCTQYAQANFYLNSAINFPTPGPLLSIQFSPFLPLLFLFCISIVSQLFGPLWNIFSSDTAAATTTTQSSSFSFSILPFGLVFSFSSIPLSSSNESPPTQGFVNPTISTEFFSKYVLLGGIIVICLGRAIRRLSEMMSRHRVTEAAHYAYTSSTNHDTAASTSSVGSATEPTTSDSNASDFSAGPHDQTAEDEEQRHMETLASGAIREPAYQSG